MKRPRKPTEKLGIDEAGKEKLSREVNDAVDRIQLFVEFGNPKTFHVRLTREGCEVKIRWTRAAAGIAGLVGLVKLLF
jgi:hypothetical protein